MRVRIRVIPGVFLLAATALALAGCPLAQLGVVAGTRLASDDYVVMKPQYKIEDKRIVVVPFSDRTQTHYASRDGIDLATYVIGELVRQSAAQNIQDDSAVRQTFAGKDVATVGWDKVAEAAGAQLVLTGRIETFRLKDPGHIMVLRGTCILQAFIYDAKTKTIVHRIPRLEVYVPETGGGIAEHDIDPEQLRARLLAATAAKIVQKYYKWQKVKRPPPRRY